MADTVTISVERLKELESLEAEVKAKKLQKHIDLKKYTDTPERRLERVKKHIDKDRDAYNARRRERRRLAKEAAAAAANPPVDGNQGAC
jgi:DNA gyrase/topoisomerase IV subunit A